MTVFFLVRHAVTDHTGHKLTGWLPDVHLTDDGRIQAEATANALRGVKFAAVISSPIDRTLETARIIAAPHHLRVSVRKRIGEVQYGRWTDRPLRSLMRTRLWGVVQSWPSGARFPDGETLREVQARAVDEIESIRTTRPKDTVCVVSHGDVIKLITAHYLGVHIDLFQRIVIAPASWTTIAVSEHGPRVLSVNSMPQPAGS
ncbi:MAG: MSMEG_4193 family putative phosphomutase [Actinomycetota bacterium]